MMNLYDMMDVASANEIGIPVNEYVERIEWLLSKNFNRGEILMNALWDDSEERRTKAKRLFLELTQEYANTI